MTVHPAVVYSLGRLITLAVVTAGLYAVGFRGWLLLLFGLVLSMPLSYVLLARQRTAWSARIEEGINRRRELHRSLALDDADLTLEQVDPEVPLSAVDPGAALSDRD